MTQDPFYQSQPSSPNYYDPPKQQNSNRTLIIIIVAIVTLFLCCCCPSTVWLLWEFGDQIVYELDLNILNVLIR